MKALCLLTERKCMKAEKYGGEKTLSGEGGIHVEEALPCRYGILGVLRLVHVYYCTSQTSTVNAQ